MMKKEMLSALLVGAGCVSASWAATGVLIDTTFSAAGDPSGTAYVDGDLAGQGLWRANTNSIPNAFSVDVSGDGIAVGFANAAKTNDASVYWDQVSTNTPGAVWSGTVAFSISALNAPKTIRSDGEEIAVFYPDYYPVFGWGISSDIAGSDLLERNPNGGFSFSDDAVIRAWVGAGGAVKFGLNDRFHGQTRLQSFTSAQLGWSPATTDTNQTPDFVTDLIECTWSIRKTTAANTYNATLSVTVGSNTYSEVLVYNSNGASKLWASDTAQFAMQHMVSTATNLLDVSVDSVSVSHTNASARPVIAPTLGGGTTGDLEITLNWSTPGEEDSIDIFRATPPSTNYTHMGNFTNTAMFTDTLAPTDDLVTFLYFARANYGGETADSVEVPVRALATTWPITCGAVDFATASGEYGATSQQSSNGIFYVTGAGVASPLKGTPSWIGSVGSVWDNTKCAVLCGVVQTTAAYPDQLKVATATPVDNIRLDLRGKGSGSALLWCEKIDGGSLDLTGGNTVGAELEVQK